MVESTGHHRHSRRKLLAAVLGGGAAASLPTAAAAAPATRSRQSVEILGRDVDVTRAEPGVVRTLKSYFEAKTAADVDATMSHFAPNLAYMDATLGWFYGWRQLHELFDEAMPTWPRTAASYPTRILGDSNSALVFFTNTPDLFGHEIRAVSAVNFEHGKIVRWIDYWDGRTFTMADIEKQRTPSDKFPTDFREQLVGETAPPTLRTATRDLCHALSSGNASRLALLFHPDGVLEDLALHITVTGRHSIESFLDAALPSLPYGQEVAMRHTIGAGQGGGFEWVSPTNAAPRGITALERDASGLVTRMTSVWDSSLWSPEEIRKNQSATILQ